MNYELNIELQNLSNPNVVYSNLEMYLDERSRLILTEQLERKAFERKHSDVHLRFSNMDGFFSSVFASSTATTRWEVRLVLVYTATQQRQVVFRGEVKLRSNTFMLNSMYVEFDAFSKTKKFWERAAEIRTIFNPSQQYYWAALEGADGYIRLQQVFDIFTNVLGLSMNGTIYSGYDLTTFSTRRMRGVKPGALCLPPIGNEGRIVEIDPAMTLAELLQAFQKKYNAEFYVDHQSRQLVMRRRNAMITNVETQIDEVLMDDQDVEVVMLDDDKVDYIYTYSYVFVTLSEQSRRAVYVDPPVRQYNQVDPGTHSWMVVGFNAANQAVLATSLLTINLPAPGGGNSGWWVTLNVPQFPAIVTTRRVYRRSGSLARARLLSTINNNTGTVFFEDRYGIALLVNGDEAPAVRNTYNLYRRFDEAAWSWQPDIIDIGERPNGTIMELRPQVRFTEIGLPQLKQEDPFDVWAFFGREEEAGLFQDDWRDWFVTKRKVRCKVKNVGYQLNQPVACSRFPTSPITNSTAYVVKRFSADIVGNQTELELLSV